MRKEYLQTTPTQFENIAAEYQTMNVNMLYDILQLAYDYNDVEKIRDYLEKTLPTSVNNLSEKANKTELAIDTESFNRSDWNNWADQLSNYIPLLGKLVKGVSTNVIEFHKNKLERKFVNLKHLFESWTFVYDDLCRKFNKNNVDYKTLAKFEPFETRFDMVSEFRKNYEFNQGTKKILGIFYQAHDGFLAIIKQLGTNPKLLGEKEFSTNLMESWRWYKD